jgi:glycosyltransferase involved in cell wall biosynthesis
MQNKSNYDKVLVLIPAKDEAKTLSIICVGLQQRSLKFLLIDDGSKDKSSQIALDYGGDVIRNEKSLGKGAALQAGFSWALNNTNSEFFGLIDADGQHCLEDLEKLLLKAQTLNTDLLIGQRDIRSPMPISRQIMNNIFTFILNKRTGLKAKDCLCGLRVVSRKFIESVKFSSQGFEIESEMLLRASKGKFVIAFEQVKTIYHSDRVSHIEPLKDTVMLLKYLLGKI